MILYEAQRQDANINDYVCGFYTALYGNEIELLTSSIKVAGYLFAIYNIMIRS